jgi:LiaF transmembrane domain
MRTTSWVGVVLILIGLSLLLDRFDILRIGIFPILWSLVAVFGFARTVDGFGKNRPGRVFWGTFLFLLGSYNVLRRLDIIELRSYWMFPTLLVIIGLSLAVMYTSTPKDWHLLIPSALLIGSGVAIIMTEFGYFYRYDVVRAFRLYWPVGLILFGLSLVLSKISHRS